MDEHHYWQGATALFKGRFWGVDICNKPIFLSNYALFHETVILETLDAAVCLLHPFPCWCWCWFSKPLNLGVGHPKESDIVQTVPGLLHWAFQFSLRDLHPNAHFARLSC